MRVVRKLSRMLCIAVCLALCVTSIAFAHSGRTDSSGGHRDNRNMSGLGYYHYHCGGYPAHLHSNGVCPYQGGGNTTTPKPTPPVKKVKLNKTSVKMASGTSFTLKVSNTSGKRVTWKSSNPRVISVTKNGRINAKQTGTASITVKTNTSQAKCTIKVVNPRISKSSLKVKLGQSVHLKTYGSVSIPKWSTSNSRIVSVTSKGVIKCRKIGRATINAVIDGKKLQCKVLVTK